VDSERVIQAGHSQIVRSPETVREIRRILIEHLAETSRRKVPVIPASQTTELQSQTTPEKAAKY
jgi:hypothetical protein